MMMGQLKAREMAEKLAIGSVKAFALTQCVTSMVMLIKNDDVLPLIPAPGGPNIREIFEGLKKIGVGADAFAVIAESWMLDQNTIKSEQDVRDVYKNGGIEQHPSKKEVILLYAETKTDSCMIILDIVRGVDGLGKDYAKQSQCIEGADAMSIGGGMTGLLLKKESGL